MTSAQGAQLCRVTVVGPDRRTDLAVPAGATVASLIPVLLRHTVTGTQPPVGQWALQRLGGKAFEPDGTAETLDWLEGEELYLRLVDDVMPEFDFDDIADGMATAVNGRADHWRPEFNRRLFLGLVILVMAAALAAPLVDGGSTGSAVGVAVLGVALLGFCFTSAWRYADRTLAILFGLAGCLFAGITGGLFSGGPTALRSLRPSTLLAVGVCLAVAAGIVLVMRRWPLPVLPTEPFGVAAVLGAALVVGTWLYVAQGLTTVRIVPSVAVVFFGATLLAPRLAVRVARLRGPQLPRTSEELQIDIEPTSARDVFARTAVADQFLNVVTVSAALVTGTCVILLLGQSGWAAPVFTGLLSAAVLLRARDYRGAWQRVALSVAGTTGLLVTVVWFARSLFVPVLAVLLVVIAALVAAALRPQSRRPAPRWGQLANTVETLCSVALIPVILELLGVYAWARGLGG
jgi:type VII secretion integral membrane protein EccD